VPARSAFCDEDMTTKPLTLGARLAIGYGAVILLMVVLAVLAMARAGQIDRLLGRIDEVSGIKQRYALELRSSVRDRAIAVRDVVLAPDAAIAAGPIGRIKTLNDTYARAASPLDALFDELPDILPSEKEALGAIKEQERRTQPLVERIIALHAEGKPHEAAALLSQQAAPAFADWLASTTRFIELEEKLASDDMTAARHLASGFPAWIVMLCSGALTAAVLGAWYSSHGLPGAQAAPGSAPAAAVQAAVIVPKRADDIVGAIDGIAFQANILALDAAVEALRTGAHDDTRAIVAHDVQALALRSASVARDIRDLVASPAAHTEEAVALEAIAGAVARVTAVTTVIGNDTGKPVRLTEARRRTTALLQASTAAAAIEAEAERLASIVAPAMRSGGAQPAGQI
jgi:methyl-accepting chemotaxis protein